MSRKVSRMVQGKEYWHLSCTSKKNLFPSQLSFPKPLPCKILLAEDIISLSVPSDPHRAWHKWMLDSGTRTNRKGAACRLGDRQCYPASSVSTSPWGKGAEQGEGPAWRATSLGFVDWTSLRRKRGQVIISRVEPKIGTLCQPQRDSQSPVCSCKLWYYWLPDCLLIWRNCDLCWCSCHLSEIGFDGGHHYTFLLWLYRYTEDLRWHIDSEREYLYIYITNTFHAAKFSLLL